MSSIRAARLAVGVLALLLAAGGLRGAEVRVEISASETYVGMPVMLSVIVKDAAEEQRPELPAITDARVQELAPPSRQTSTTIINGRMTQSTTVTYRWRITPERPGVLRIPGFVVEADGQQYASEPMEVIVSRSESGDLMFVEIQAASDRVYLGQPVDLTLTVWILPFRDRALNVRLDNRDMWSLVDSEICMWGPFADRLEELARQRRMPSGRETLRADREGQRRAYFRYDVTTRFWPEQAGPLALDQVAVAMAYPLRLERNRSLLRLSGLTVAEARPVRVVADPPDVTVLAPPAEGRPEWFNGAVGRFDLGVKAAPLEAAVGEPITLTVLVNDLTPGGSRLELLPPPPLARVDVLNERFRIPADPLAGVVSGRTKRFEQTVRPVDDSVRQVPAIPFSFFDPIEETYRTIWSEPIDLTVRPASTVSMADVVGGEVPEDRPTELTDVAGGLLANYVEPSAVLRSQRIEPGWWVALLLGGPPLLSAGVLLVQRRHRRLRDDLGYSRQRQARRQALARIAAAAAAAAADRTELVAGALGGYVADRCNLPAGATTSADLVQALRDRGAADAVVERVDELMQRCEAARYAGLDGAGERDLVGEVREVVDRLERERLA
jgi:hypothetical protein